MAQAPGAPEERDAPPRDWFLAAIESNGTVAESLTAVLAELEARAGFITVLKLALSGKNPKGVDAITELGGKIKSLENTLRFRLGILRPERPQAWFRAPAATSTGPFSSTLLEEPVFAPYDPADTERVRVSLSDCYRLRTTESLPFKDQSSCLWRTLLAYAEELAAIAKLAGPFEGLDLGELPDGLPPGLESRALRAFLMNVKAEVTANRERLDACYRQLWETSEKFWAHQLEEQKLKRAKEGQERPRVKNAAADAMREELKKRRAADQLKPLLTPADLDAMKFMGFDELPTTEMLRHRYLAMAKRLHPDRQGGSDYAFKILSTAYAHLTARLDAPVR